jgi:hypothetical protein
MSEQQTFATLAWQNKKKVPRRKQFLAEMNRVIPWTALLALIAPHYPTGSRGPGRPPMPLDTMLRVSFLQQWFDLSDPAAEDALYDSKSLRRRRTFNSCPTCCTARSECSTAIKRNGAKTIGTTVKQLGSDIE